MHRPDFLPIPPSGHERATLWNSYNAIRAELALYFGQDLVGCGKLTDSRVRALFESKPFETWKKNREHEGKYAGAQLSRLDAVIKSVGNVAEIIAKSSRRAI